MEPTSTTEARPSPAAGAPAPRLAVRHSPLARLMARLRGDRSVTGAHPPAESPPEDG